MIAQIPLYDLKTGGVIFISVKEGEEDFVDGKGRYMNLFTDEEMRQLLERADIDVIDYWKTKDGLGRQSPSWINFIGRRR